MARTSRSSVLPGDGLGGDLLAPLRKVGRVVDDRADDAAAAEVVLDVGSDLELEVVEALVERLLGQTSDLLVVVSEPSDGGGVSEGGGRGRRKSALAWRLSRHKDARWVSRLDDLLLALLLGGLLGLQQSESLLGRDSVGDVAEDGRADELLLQSTQDRESTKGGRRTAVKKNERGRSRR